MDEIISYKMCAVKVRNAKLRNYLNQVCPYQLYLKWVNFYIVAANSISTNGPLHK
jgi:hypothetical protein